MMLKIDKTTNYEHKSARGSSPQFAASSWLDALHIASNAIETVLNLHGCHPASELAEALANAKNWIETTQTEAQKRI